MEDMDVGDLFCGQVLLCLFDIADKSDDSVVGVLAQELQPSELQQSLVYLE